MPVALVTGANGFIGRRLCSDLVACGWTVRALCRRPPDEVSRCAAISWIQAGNLADVPVDVLAGHCERVHTTFHVAGRAHRRDRGRDPGLIDEYRRDNVETTRRVFAAASRAGVSRFVYVSSIKVLGDVSAKPLVPDDVAAPADTYAQSKWEAERALRESAHGTPGVSVVRPPLVYGQGVAGNMAMLLRWIHRGWPLPLGCATASRSFVSLGNLCDLLTKLPRRDAAFEVLHVRDGEDLSVSELVCRIGEAMGRRARLVPVPAGVMRAGMTCVGKSEVYSRLFEPLRVDDSATRAMLGWRPPESVEQALAAWTASWKR